MFKGMGKWPQNNIKWKTQDKYNLHNTGQFEKEKGVSVFIYIYAHSRVLIYVY